MDTAPPPLHSENIRDHPDFAAMSMDRFTGRGSVPDTLDGSITDRNGAAGAHHRSQSVPAPTSPFGGQDAAFGTSSGQPKTDLDSLEDSFKFAVGIAPVHKANRGKGSPRTHAAAASSGIHAQNGRAHSSFDVPEEVLLRDVLYALQAVESRYLYFDDAADRFQITRSVGVPTRE
jgi:hypothetical protein